MRQIQCRLRCDLAIPTSASIDTTCNWGLCRFQGSRAVQVLTDICQTEHSARPFPLAFPSRQGPVATHDVTRYRVCMEVATRAINNSQMIEVLREEPLPGPVRVRRFGLQSARTVLGAMETGRSLCPPLLDIRETSSSGEI